jgi:hypothetical protein
MPVRICLATVVCVLLLPYGTVDAQQGDDDAVPETRFITTSTFHVPYGDDRTSVMWWVDSVMVPTNRMNPNVHWLRIVTHNHGSNGGDVVLMREYMDWAAIGAPCEACNEWFQERQPEEGTPERAEWDAHLAMFLKYYGQHADQIYTVNMSRAK